MNHQEAARALTQQYPKILEEFHAILKKSGLADVVITGMEFRLRTVVGKMMEIVQSDCPPGTSPTMKCVPTPGGGVYCRVICEE